MMLGRRLLTGLLALVVFAIAAASASAATKPTAITGPVTASGSTTATITGTLNPNGAATTWYFEYGKTTGYGSKSATQNAGSGTNDVAASAALTGLTANTTYHYRLVATNSAGTSRGTDGIFATSTAVSAVTNPATNVTLTSATLNGAVNPMGHTTTWYFEYGTNTNYGTKTALKDAGSGTGAVSVSVPVSGLTTGKTYHYRIVATNTAGTAHGSDITFSTAALPTAVTAAASAVGTTTATLNGSVNPNGQATSWYFEYGTSTSYGATTPSHNAGSGSSSVAEHASISNLAAGTTYHFRLVAKNAAGTSRGADQSFATTGVTIHASALDVIYGHTVALSGTVSSGGAGESVAIFVKRYGQTSFVSVATVLTSTGGTWSYTGRPAIRTDYEAVWKSATSATTSVGVHPAVTIRTLKNARFSVHVAAGRSFAGKYIKLQRLSKVGQWVTIGYARLSVSSTWVFHPKLPKGVSKLRAAFSVNQAGAGYLGGLSRTISFRKR